MGKGLKKFLAMVGVISLASGMGALSCSADETANKGASTINPNTVPTGKAVNEGASTINPNTVPTGKAANKDTNIISSNTANTGETANISTVPGKKGLSNLAVAGIIAGGVAIVSASIALIVKIMLLNGDDSEN